MQPNENGHKVLAYRKVGEKKDVELVLLPDVPPGIAIISVHTSKCVGIARETQSY